MIDPYRMVFINIIASILVFGGAFVYKYIYPKKNVNLLVLLILISLLPLISMLRKGTYESGDLSLHAVRTMSFYRILFIEHILPRWTPEFYAGYGDPYFAFAYFLQFFLGSVFHFIGFSFLASLKLLLAISFVLSGVFMYVFVKNELGEEAGFTAGIFYMFAPFHLINMHFQVTIGMVLSYVFLPLNLYLTKKILINPKQKWFIFFSISEMLLILSHQVTSLLFLPINILYALFLVKDKNKKINRLLKFFASLCFSLMLSAFYWLPIITEIQFTQQFLLKKDSLLFPSISQLLYSPWRYGLLFQGHKGELSYIIGYTQIFVIILSLYLLIKNKYDKKIRRIFIFFISIFFLLFFFILPISKPLWFIIPFIKSFQYSSRLLIPLSLCIAILAGITINTINKKWFFILLCSITVFYTILNWGNRTTIPSINDQILIKQNAVWPVIGIVGLEQSSPIWANTNPLLGKEKRSSDIETLSGKTSVKNISRKSNLHIYSIVVKSNFAWFKENTLYFPGWTLLIDGKKTSIDYLNPRYRGIIIFKATKGVHEVKLYFAYTFIRKLSLGISFITLFLLILYLRRFFSLRHDSNVSRRKSQRDFS